MYSYALTQIEGVGNVIAHRLWCEVGSASALFLQPEIWQKINPVLYKKIAKQLHDKRLIEGGSRYLSQGRGQRVIFDVFV